MVQSVHVLVVKTNPRIRIAIYFSEHSKKLKNSNWLSKYSADAKNQNAKRVTATVSKPVSLARKNAAATYVQTKRAARTLTLIRSQTNTQKSPILIIRHLKTKLGPKKMRRVLTTLN